MGKNQLSSDLLNEKFDFFSCVIWTLCIPNQEYQLINPTTQVALYALCFGNCSNLQSIQWEIYSGEMNSSSNFTTWILFNQNNSIGDNWFFGKIWKEFSWKNFLWYKGRNRSNFTAKNRLFLENPHITLWRFEIVYQFLTASSSSSLNFIINTPPVNGTCSINPTNGTTNTLFTIVCSNWFDDDQIKDYLLFVWEDDPSELTFVAFSLLSKFDVRFPSGQFHLIVHIRDMADCITVSNLTSIHIQSDLTFIENLINHLDQANENPLIDLLSTGNPNTIGQVLNSVSQQLNTMNNQTIEQARSSKFISIIRHSVFCL